MTEIIIKNGRIWDGTHFFPGNLLIENGKIAGMGDVDGAAEYTIDAFGAIVSPGLVDIHTHFRGISIDEFGMQAELGCIPFGVTAAAECGAEFGGEAALQGLSVRTVAFVPAIIRGNRFQASETEKRLSLFGSRLMGLKVYFDTTMTDLSDIRPLRECCAYAREKGLKMCVHSSHSPTPMSAIAEALSSGDILTHCYHGGVHSAAEEDFRALRLAREKGIVIDSGHAGHVHTDFALLRQALAQGFGPDTISTDLTRLSAYRRGGRYGMTLCMSYFRTLGWPEEEIFRSVTGRAARALNRPEWGNLTVGGPADVVIFDTQGGSYCATDAAGNVLRDDSSYRCRLTIMNGQILYRQ